MSWGLDIDALKYYDVVPSELCLHTTHGHYACTISHLLLMYQAYVANEVCLSSSVSSHSAADCSRKCV